MKRFILCLIAGALGAAAATELRSAGILGAHGGFQGSSVWVQLHLNWYDAFPATVNTTTGVVTATGSNFGNVNTGGILFWPDAGGTLPGGLANHLSYTLCSKPTTESFTASITLAATCGALVSWGTDAGAGAWKAGKSYSAGVPPAGADHTWIKNFVLPTGVTIGKCLLATNLLPNCNLVAGEYQSYKGQDTLWFRLDIASDAPVGTFTFGLTYYCKTEPIAGCTTTGVNMSVPFKIEALTVIPRTPPASYPAIAEKATWETKLLARAAEFCTDKANGTINWDPFTVFTFSGSGEAQIWYYDGMRFYYWVADYTGDAQWKNCGDTIARAYTATLMQAGCGLGRCGDFNGFHEAFFAGPYYSTRNYNMAGRTMTHLVYLNNLAGRTGAVSEVGMRENAYTLHNAMMEARFAGYERYEYIPDDYVTPGGPSPLKERIKRNADMMLGSMWTTTSTDADEWIYTQAFHMGICMKFAIEWYRYSSDERVPVMVKRTVDMLRSTMTNLDPTNYPGQIAWMRGTRFNPPADGGPKCAYNCSPYPNLQLHGMIIPAYAFLYFHTGNSTYQTEGDALFNLIYTTYGGSGNSGKLNNELFGWWSRDYVDYREGRLPQVP